jgi:DNA-binding transcriptional regulator YdaS (Cro superfamily)
LAKAAVTQRALARLLGMPHASLNQMITGRMAPRIALEAEIEAALTAVERTGNTVGP